MADIFVSYARTDKARVAPLVAALEAQGWSVWWDPAITPGEEFDRLISTELKRASAVLVVWTPTSVESRWVRGEARDGADRGILVPVRFEQAELPIDVRALHTIDLDTWDGDAHGSLLEPLRQALDGLIQRTKAPAVSAARTSAPARNARASICVLPFANMSGDPEQEYFSDGISEDVITDLSKVSALFVVARNTSFTFKGRHVDVLQLAQRLDVTHVLEGSVRKASGRVRITAQLIDGRTGGHLWAERYDRDLHDIFALQDEISEAIVGALKLRLLPEEKRAIETRGTSDLAAYDFYLRGRQLTRREKETESRAAAEMFRQAARLDPMFAAAYAGLAQILALLIFRKQSLAPTLMGEARQASERALELAPQQAEAWVARAMVLMVAREWAASGEAFERAIAIDPRSFDAHYFYARYWVTQGNHAQAVERYERAYAIDPTNYLPMVLSIQEKQALGDEAGIRSAVERAWAAIERQLALDPDDSAAYDHGAGVLMTLGRLEESRQFSERALALRPDDGSTHYNAACCAAIAGDYERAIDLLVRAADLGYGNVDWMLHDNDLVPLHGHPRFQALAARLQKQ
ncbi:MAG TPA: TIR domain-containing protein [Steroidobacteraceae bacterium]